MRHRLVLTSVDLGLIGLATLCAQFLRDNFDTSPDQVLALLPYVGLTGCVAIPVLTATGLNRSIWCLSAMADYLRAAVATLAIVTVAVVLGFLVNRLEGVARSLPILQAALVLCALVGVRVTSRLRYAGRDSNWAQAMVLSPSSQTGETILVVGINRVTELYLRSLAEYSPGRIKIAGLLATKQRHTGRLVQGHKILGMPEEVTSVLRALEVHGVGIERIVVTVAFDALSADAQAALLDVERRSNIKIEFFADNIGIVGPPVRMPTMNNHQPFSERTDDFALHRDGVKVTLERRYWRLKRAIDLIVASSSFVVLAPLIVLVTVLVAFDVGLPAIFWQQRPGKDGRPFRLYKFRTMRAPHDAQGHRILDDERLSVVGRLLRRFRLDELPQLYNVLVGEMSFIGPRPLLPQDQFPALAARLAIRPGLTGWAQIKGGRDLAPSDKAALDVWYVKNGSLRVDLEIILATLRMILFGERTDPSAIREAWFELGCDRLERPQNAPNGGVDHVRGPLSNDATDGNEGRRITAISHIAR